MSAAELTLPVCKKIKMILISKPLLAELEQKILQKIELFMVKGI